ncbi:MAG: serine hydrolase domain-containing protein [Myxococcota bacterium]
MPRRRAFRLRRRAPYPGSVTIDGSVAPGFEPVREAFAENFEKHGEIGAAVCVIQDGRPLVDLWGGMADPVSSQPWTSDTLGVIFSATKGLMSLAFLMQRDLDVDDRVTDHWPAFGVAGKWPITIRQLLNHRSGLCAIDQSLTLEDFEDPARLQQAMLRQVPLWRAGEDQGYGPISMGVYGGELFHRIAGETVGTFLQRDVADRLDADVYLGGRATLRGRTARLLPVRLWDVLTRIIPRVGRMPEDYESRMFKAILTPGTAAHRAVHNPRELGMMRLENYDSPRVQDLELPFANGLASARGLARVYAPLANEGRHERGRFLPADVLTPLYARQSWSDADRVLFKPVGFSQGFMKEETTLFSPNKSAFGHPGAGGSLGFADPDRGLSIGYVMNRMSHRLRSPRALSLCEALNDCL